MWLLRQSRRFAPPCLRAGHSPLPSPLMPVLSISRCNGPGEPRCAMLTVRVFWRRLRVLKSGTARSRPIRRSKHSAKPTSCRSALPNSTSIVRQARIAASLQSGCRPRLPVGAASPQVMAGSNHIASEPRRFNASFQAGQFMVLQTGGVGLLFPRLPDWIRKMIPLWDLRNRAAPHCKAGRQAGTRDRAHIGIDRAGVAI